jgi:acetyl esterase/lipase
MPAMPVGYLVSVLFCAAATALALWPRRTNGPRATPAYIIETAANEVPFAILYLLLAATLLTAAQGQLTTPLGLASLVLAAITIRGLSIVVRRALLARPTLDRALAAGLGPRWRDALEPEAARQLRPHLGLGRALVAPIRIPSREMRRVRNLSYGPEGRANLLDLYHHRSRPNGCPVLVYFHGGGFFSGDKSREARLIFDRLVSNGWVCVSANYRLAKGGVFPDCLADAQRAIGWARQHAPDYGGDADTVFLAGGSAGAHLAATCALTGGTSVAGAVLLYGFYGRAPIAGGASSTAPADHVGPDAPPFLVVHGDHDPMVDPGQAAEFTEQLRAVSSTPVVHAELPGGQHAFDRFASIRCAAVADAIGAFTGWCRSTSRS